MPVEKIPMLMGWNVQQLGRLNSVISVLDIDRGVFVNTIQALFTGRVVSDFGKRDTEFKNYRKKPVVVQACQWFKNGDHPDDGCPSEEGRVVRRFRNPEISSQCTCSVCGRIFHYHGWIETLEGGHIVCPGDFVITGVNGERYPCKPDIFEQTYDLVEGDDGQV